MDNVEVKEKTVTLLDSTNQMPSWLLEINDNIEKMTLCNDAKSTQTQIFLNDDQYYFKDNVDYSLEMLTPCKKENDAHIDNLYDNGGNSQISASKSLPNTPKNDKVQDKQRKIRACSAVVNTKHSTKDDFSRLDAYLERKKIEKYNNHLVYENYNIGSNDEKMYSDHFPVQHNYADARLYLLDENYYLNSSTYSTQNEDGLELLPRRYKENSISKSTIAIEDSLTKETSCASNNDLSTDKIHKNFIIPELPSGDLLIIDILSTWGDKHYVGLNGIEIFSYTGEPAKIKQIYTDSESKVGSSNNDYDPHVINSLINGINRTRDDANVWLTPYSNGDHHYIYIIFEYTIVIAMIRIWNYNKSRVHSFRGVKDVVIKLNDIIIFDGEIAKAPGHDRGTLDSFGDTILFTTDESILELISKHDNTFIEYNNEMINSKEAETNSSSNNPNQ